jgi:hypothetical protein
LTAADEARIAALVKKAVSWELTDPGPPAGEEAAVCITQRPVRPRYRTESARSSSSQRSCGSSSPIESRKKASPAQAR